MHNRPFRWGIIGPGKIARKFAGALLGIDNAVLFGVASRSAERARAFASEFNAQHIFDSYEELAAHSEIDAVYIATPHNFHYEQVLMCLESGKPVLCEKPLTVNRRESEQLFSKSKENHLFLMEALWTRFLPIYSQVRTWLDADKIGEIALLDSSFGMAFPRNPEGRVLNPNLAGGGLLDLGVYNVAISQWTVKKNPKTIQAEAYLGDTGVDERTSVILGYEGCHASQFTCSTISTFENHFNIFGSNGSIRIHNPFWGATRATLKTASEDSTITKPFRINGFEYQIEEAMKCIGEGKIQSPGITHEHTLANMTVMDAIREQIGLRYPFE